MEPLEPMRPVGVTEDTHTSTPIWKSAPVTLGTVGVFAYALMSTRTGVVEVALGAVIAIAGVALYFISVMRTIRENSDSRVPLLGTPPVSPRDVDLLDRSGRTALHHAVERKSLPLLKALKAAGADCATRSGGKDPAELAAQTGFDAGFAVLADAAYWRSRTLQAPQS